MSEFDEQGYTIYKGIAPAKAIYNLAYWKDAYDIPTRGHDVNGVYYNKFVSDVDWANYWTDPLNEHTSLLSIRKVVDDLVDIYLDDPVFYHADVSVLTPKCNAVRPHIDTPHRHTPFNDRIHKRLGIQVAIPMSEYNIRCGVTGLLPGSHKKFWDIKKCYKGEYTAEFMKSAIQPELNYGDILMWDSRLLHSQMPNVSSNHRYMILLNYVEKDIVQELMEYESTLTS